MHHGRYIIFVTDSVVQQDFKIDMSTDRGIPKDFEKTLSQGHAVHHKYHVRSKLSLRMREQWNEN